KEVLDEEEELVLTVNIDNLREEGAPERDPEWVFQHTFPSESVRTLIRTLSSVVDKRLSGCFLIKGGYGTGKSHLLLLIYHLLKKEGRKPAVEWLERWKAFFTGVDLQLAKSLVEGAPEIYPLVISTKGKGGRYKYLWEFVLKELGNEGEKALEAIRAQTVEGRSPDWDAITDAISGLANDRFFLLILDELDEWIEELEEAVEANYFFIDKLAEAFGSKKIDGLFICSLRQPSRELEAKFERAQPEYFYPGKSEDRSTIIRFRLFRESDEEDRKVIRELAKTYVESYKRIFDVIEVDPGFEKFPPLGEDMEALQERFSGMWPLHPRLVDAILVRYDQLKEEAKEGIRGPLFIFIDLLEKLEEVPITAGLADYRIE
ncbi:MAG: hypothetical protein GTO54_11005, partial [Nitrososphaeria archaeon]|nr:hypothetical protein [Nitrososphaeria archaeon]